LFGVEAERGDAPRHGVLGAVVGAGFHQPGREVALLVVEGRDDGVGFQHEALGGVGGDVVTVADRDIRAFAGFDGERHLLGDVRPLHRDVLDDDVLVLGVELLDQLRHEDRGCAARPAVPEADGDLGAVIVARGGSASGEGQAEPGDGRDRDGAGGCSHLHLFSPSSAARVCRRSSRLGVWGEFTALEIWCQGSLR
jgi:hypothetical protein